MICDKYGQQVYTEDDIADLLMSGVNLSSVLVDKFNPLVNQMAGYELTSEYNDPGTSVEQFDKNNQNNWWMPDEYKQMDIAKYILNQCKTDAELQRVGEELLLYQERNLFDLLKYLKYLVDTMQEHNIIWGVGRGSSVASYVLYLLGVHRVDSIFYNLDVHEFLR